MPRAPRIYDPGGMYHVTAHGVHDAPIFLDDLDRQSFLLRLGRVVARLEWRVLAMCLMTNHFHLVIQLRDDNLGEGMHVVNGGHARQFNARHRRRGALFESRYGVEPIEGDSHLLSAIRYVARNPVKAGMVDAPEAWPWSTYAQLVGLARPWPFFEPASVLALFSGEWTRAVALVRDFVEAAEEVPGTFEGARYQFDGARY